MFKYMFAFSQPQYTAGSEVTVFAKPWSQDPAPAGLKISVVKSLTHATMKNPDDVADPANVSSVAWTINGLRATCTAVKSLDPSGVVVVQLVDDAGDKATFTLLDPNVV